MDDAIQYVWPKIVALDLALGVGGLPRGRIVEIYGPEASGKTTLALHIIAEAQNADVQQPQPERVQVLGNSSSVHGRFCSVHRFC